MRDKKGGGECLNLAAEGNQEAHVLEGEGTRQGIVTRMTVERKNQRSVRRAEKKTCSGG